MIVEKLELRFSHLDMLGVYFGWKNHKMKKITVLGKNIFSPLIFFLNIMYIFFIFWLLQLCFMQSYFTIYAIIVSI